MKGSIPSHSSRTISKNACTPESSSRDSSPELQLSAARRPIVTPSSRSTNDSSAHQVGQGSRQSSPDVPLRQVAQELSQALTPKRALTVDTSMANTAPVVATTASTSTINAPDQDTPTEPDLFRQLLDASVEPLSAEDMQSAQAMLEETSLTNTALQQQQTSLEQTSRGYVSYTSPYSQSMSTNTGHRNDELFSAISPRTTTPFLPPPPPRPHGARHTSTSAIPPSLILRSNSPPRPFPTRTTIPTPASPRRQSYVQSTYASAQIRVCRPRPETAIPQSAPHSQIAFNYRPSIVQASSSYVRAPSFSALNDRERAILAQQFAETGGLGGLPLPCSVRSCGGDSDLP